MSKLTRKDLAKNVALMSQASNIYFSYTVYETVSLGRYAHIKGVFSKIGKEDDEIILKSIENVGLLDIKDKLITELSVAASKSIFSKSICTRSRYNSFRWTYKSFRFKMSNWNIRLLK